MRSKEDENSNDNVDDDDDNNNNNNNSVETIKPLLLVLKILYNSLEFFPRNKRISISIFTLLTFPLSYLLFSFSLSARPIKAHIYHLEALVRFAPTRFEARHVWKESRADAISLLRLRLLYFLPSYSLSLLSAITAVVSVHSYSANKRLSFNAALSHVKLTWKRPLVTTIYIYAVMLLYSHLVSFLAFVSGNVLGGFRMLVLAAGFVLEVYVMAVAGLGLVVSVIEDRFGFDAIRVGSDLMQGRRLCGWVLTSWFVMVSGLIGWRWDQMVVIMMAGGDYSLGKERWTVAIGSWDKLVLVILYGTAVLWSFVVTTLFYCECKKRRVITTQNDGVVVAV